MNISGHFYVSLFLLHAEDKYFLFYISRLRCKHSDEYSVCLSVTDTAKFVSRNHSKNEALKIKHSNMILEN
jgi:hypothetical protein